MAEESKSPAPNAEVPPVKEPHLLDPGSLPDMVNWIGPFILGFLADVAYDVAKDQVRELLNNVKKRFGKPRVREVEAEVRALIADVKSRSDLGDEEIQSRTDEIFRDFR